MRHAFDRGALALAAAVILAISLAGCDRPVEGMGPPPVLRIGVGSRGGDFDVMGRALAETLRAGTPAYGAEIVSNEGAVSILDSLQQGKSDCGFSYADVAYEGYVGRSGDEPSPLRRVRGVALVEITPLHLVVRRDRSIKSVHDLPGHSIAIGPRWSGSYRTALLVLDAFGVDVNKIDVEVASFRGVGERMRSGSLDGHFVLIAQRANSIANLTADNAEIIPLEGKAIDTLRDRYPFLHPAVIPPDTYPNQHSAIRTVAVESLLVCGDDVAAEHVRRLTADWFTTLTKLAKEGRVTDAVNPALAASTPIPLHAGASEYYRARQVQLR